ncbi:MAG: hypothetical protein A2X22_03155 [Bacteroidetes bacterium GWF2_49_14]|nr:MAG: hypothetical protein A2X22_03155 [Bacteroidetes bacterium GWF2_49_14]HBB93035.1 hypothetical protein [Bacteroidales bacterium]
MTRQNSRKARGILFSAWIVFGSLISFLYAQNLTGGKVIRLDLQQTAKASGSLKLSDIADDISYVKLETTKDCFFTPSQFIVRENCIYARDRDNGKVLLFNRQGKFLRQIGKIGKGPTEHLGAFTMQASLKGDRVYLFSKKSNRLTSYSSEGQKLSEFAVKYPSWGFAPMSDNQFIFLTPFGFPSPDSSAFFFYLQDNQGNVKRKIKTHRNIPIGGAIEFGRFFINPALVLAYQPFCDTVFEISPKGDFLPRYVLEFGKNRMPDDVWFDRDKFERVKYDYINSVNLLPTKGILFIRFGYQKTRRIGLVSLSDGATKGSKTTSGLIENDIDGGPDFWPGETNGINEVYSFVQPVDLLQKWQRGEFKDRKFRSQADNARFVEMVNSLREDDNPVMVIVRLK